MFINVIVDIRTLVFFSFYIFIPIVVFADPLVNLNFYNISIIELINIKEN